MRKIFRIGVLLSACLALSLQASEFGQVQIKVAGKVLTLELAQSPEQRARGLMHRESLCDDCGMLFVYREPRLLSMWMKNTLIPLDVAFVDEQGEILVIKPMQPRDLTPVGTEQAASYAWEMNQGWFRDNDIQVGDRFEVLEAQ
ncbi:DUF192 domain-containing protein [Lacimicrobium alkaliphilum]|uniref:DUF192 domain-containing protein n=1 Tax=Lacimicrobium alkaliphilum TaxID=1526571 RepID=A0ABQ1RE97_9ALTE|nr:DUF192 domain-containing protein [Lacimicrobium alkaliphilum]GGD64930.1 hypothetical protein GCM10011357_20350 [Lacimicrobium alkaliphilum]